MLIIHTNKVFLCRMPTTIMLQKWSFNFFYTDQSPVKMDFVCLSANFMGKLEKMCKSVEEKKQPKHRQEIRRAIFPVANPRS